MLSKKIFLSVIVLQCVSLMIMKHVVFYDRFRLETKSSIRKDNTQFRKIILCIIDNMTMEKGLKVSQALN
jgi:hypothetical protein